MFRKILLSAALALICLSVIAQSDTLLFYKGSIKTNNTGMYVLASWAVLNLATGAYGWKNGSGGNKYFHQMNLFWNTVNMSIATYALANNYLTDYHLLTGEQLYQKHLTFEKLYLINAGLDVVYMGVGLGLRTISFKNEKRKDMLYGYGNSIILQGGFLFAFDAVMYLIQHHARMEFLREMNLGLNLGMNTFGIYLNL